MRIVLLDHPRIAVPELRGDDGEGGTIHGEMAGVDVAQDVERNRRFNLRNFAHIFQSPGLMRLLPGRPIFVAEEEGALAFATGLLFEEAAGLVAERHEPFLAVLARLYVELSLAGYEVPHHHARQFAVAAAGEQSRSHEFAEVGRAGGH